jgi:hypothetical protein
MTEATIYVTQSKFFSACFNAAIFDGPVRIYFAQYQEPQALKIYFQIQQRLHLASADARSRLRQQGCHVFVMLYPTSQLFDETFGESIGTGAVSAPWIQRQKLGKDFVVGVRGPIEDHQTFALYQEVGQLLG